MEVGEALRLESPSQASLYVLGTVVALGRCAFAILRIVELTQVVGLQNRQWTTFERKQSKRQVQLQFMITKTISFWKKFFFDRHLTTV